MMRSLVHALVLFSLLAGSGVAQSRYAPGEILVAPVTGHDEDVIRHLVQLGLRIEERDALSGVLRVAVTRGDEDLLAGELGQRDDVIYAERNGLGSGGMAPNDTFFGSQWHLENTGQGTGTAGADIEAVPAWNITTGTTSTVVAVLDSGIDFNHPDFVGRIEPGGQDFVNNDMDPTADHPHGIWVSGVLGANADNGFGAAGVDWQCRILPLKVLNSNNGGNAFDLAQALNYVATQARVQVVCMSLINYPPDTTLINALQTASAAGKILISCAGNGGAGNADVSYPGASPLTISVGATDNRDRLATFSSTGAALDFVGPGDQIVTSAGAGATNTTTTVSGCSFATPMTCGIIGLVLARMESLGMTPPDQQQIYALLQGGAEDQVGPSNQDVPGRDDFFGHGRINALGTLQQLPTLGPCAEGNVAAAAGGPEDVLLANGVAAVNGERKVTGFVGEPLTLEMLAPSTNPGADFVLWGILGTPAVTDELNLPGIGDMCFAPATVMPQTGAFTFASSVPTLPGLLPATPAPWTLAFPSFPLPLEITLQGLIIDDPQGNVAVTNALILETVTLPAPLITAISDPTGIAGATVTITGTGFRPGLTLQVAGQAMTPGTVTATSVTFPEPGSLACDMPVSLTNPDGQSASSAFNPSPVILNLITPAGTPAAGGAFFVLQGRGFFGASTITIGGNPVMITQQSPTSIFALSPPGSVGPATLAVTTPFGCSASTTYTYTP